MDNSQIIANYIRSLGGSDSSSPSFNYLRYVKFFSVNNPRLLGEFGDTFLDIEGLVGAESGTQTLFFEVLLREPARIGLRKIKINPYTDQYISIALFQILPDRDRPLPLGVDGAANSNANPNSFRRLRTEPLEIGYVGCGYWDSGYAEYDCQFVVSLDEVSLGDADPGDPFDISAGEKLPAGPYRFTVSSSQWAELPYRIQFKAEGSPSLSGTATLVIEPRLRLGLAKLSGSADLELDPSGTLGTVANLSGSADLTLEGPSRLDVLSPFS
jgi:hypothetical protein